MVRKCGSLRHKFSRVLVFLRSLRVLLLEAGRRSPRPIPDSDVGLTPEAGRPAPVRTTRLRTWSRLVVCAGTVVKTVVTTGRETVGQTGSPQTSHVSATQFHQYRADARGWWAYAPSDPSHRNRADARGWWAYARFEPGAYARAHAVTCCKRIFRPFEVVVLEHCSVFFSAFCGQISPPSFSVVSHSHESQNSRRARVHYHPQLERA